MYKHLLVPVDESLLSSENVRVALRLADSLNARVTFFHATADFGGTGDGALIRAIEPQQFGELARGHADSVLSKAMLTARHAGIACEGLARTCDQPAQAIIEMAVEMGCDLIVMASRGARGLSAWLHGSQTERVLKQSPVALLVSRVESNEPLKASERALGVIRDEHRSLAVVIMAMNQIVSAHADGNHFEAADIITLEAMLMYMREFPQRMHHPKEEQYLHPPLRERVPSCHDVLAELEAQHQHEAQLVDAVDEALKDFHAGVAGATLQLVSTVQLLFNAVKTHIGMEERVILPMAAQQLSEQDWQAAADAFSDNHDPDFGNLSTEEFNRIFSRVMAMPTTRSAIAEALTGR